MKRLIRTLIFAWAALGLAVASPAQDLFDQAAYLLAINYGGFSSSTPKALVERYQLELDAACATQGDACPYATAHPVISRMLEALEDGHSGFLPAASFAQLSGLIYNRAEAGLGTGLYTVPAKRSASRIVLDVQPDSPAARAGLQRGDRIVAANNRALSSYGQDARAVLRGTSGPVRVLVLRAGRSFTRTLEPQSLPPAPYPRLTVRDDGVAVLRLPSFLVADLGERVRALVREARARNAKGLILDLRDNGGGLVSEYVRVVGAFTSDPGRVFDSPNPLSRQVLQFRDGDVRTGTLEAPAANPDRWAGPLAVLVNASSASASEFTAHDLQRYAKATVIGERTAGVGNTMTATFPLEDGSGLLITLARAVRPDGSPYPERITPDVAVPDDLEAINRSGRDPAMEAALEAVRTAR